MRVKNALKVTGKRLPTIIRNERQRRGHSLRAAAVEMKSCPEAVRKWELGLITPMEEKLLRIAAYVNQPLSVTTQIWSDDRKSKARR